MKKLSQKALALLLALSVLLCAALPGCSTGQDTALAQPDEVAEAIFKLVIKNDASAAKEALGYESEAAARADFMGESEEDFYATMAEEIIRQFEETGATVSQEDGQLLLNAFLSMMGKVQFRSEVKTIDEKAGTATVTCHVSTFDPDAISDALANATAQLLSDPALLSDMDALVSAMIGVLAEAMEKLEPSDQTTDFDTDFALREMVTAGKTQKVWVPADAAAFGEALSTAALGR